MLLSEQKLKALIRKLLSEQSDGDYNQSQIESFSRGEKSYNKIRKLMPLSLMTHDQFKSRIGSIGCFWGDFGINNRPNISKHRQQTS